ncbi:MAG: matrixin family metalloprotease [Archangium sp.]
MLSRLLPLLTLISLPAFAFELQTDEQGDLVQWRKAVTFVVDEALAAKLGVDQTRPAVTGVVAEVRAAAPQLPFDVKVGALGEGAIGYQAGRENVNAVVSVDEWPYAPSNLAVTLTTLNARTNEILDTDILFNVKGHLLAILPANETHYDRGFDFQNALTHEVGHALGLSHNDADEGLVMFSSTFPGELSKRTLKQDDRDGLKTLYGAGLPVATASTTGASNVAIGADGEEVTPVAGCSATGAMPMLLVGLLGLLRNRRRAAVAAVTMLTGTAVFAAEPSRAELQNADTVAVARVMDRESTLHPTTPGLIVTRLTLVPSSCLKGSCDELRSVVMWGGRVGDLEQIVAHEPVPAKGAEVIVIRTGRTISVLPAPAIPSQTPTTLNR